MEIRLVRQVVVDREVEFVLVRVECVTVWISDSSRDNACRFVSWLGRKLGCDTGPRLWVDFYVCGRLESDHKEVPDVHRAAVFLANIRDSKSTMIWA